MLPCFRKPNLLKNSRPKPKKENLLTQVKNIKKKQNPFQEKSAFESIN